MLSKYSLAIRWGSFALAILLPFIAWTGYYNWQLSELTIYQIFPLLGITAFTIMTTHFIISAIKTKTTLPDNPTYTKVNGLVVLGLILLHPMLFYYQLFKDGYGIPPTSSIEFVGESLAFYIFLGTFGLILFLSYDIARYLSKKPIIKNNWFWVIISQYVAMVAIFFHAWGLGGITQYGWFRFAWVLFGFAMAASALFVLPAEIRKNKYVATHHQSGDSTKVS